MRCMDGLITTCSVLTKNTRRKLRSHHILGKAVLYRVDDLFDMAD